MWASRAQERVSGGGHMGPGCATGSHKKVTSSSGPEEGQGQAVKHLACLYLTLQMRLGGGGGLGVLPVCGQLGLKSRVFPACSLPQTASQDLTEAHGCRVSKGHDFLILVRPSAFLESPSPWGGQWT